MALRTITLLIAMIIGGLVLAAAYISTLIIERQDALKRVSRYNTAWLASQAVSEFRQLQYGISAFAVPGSGVEREEVELRFDILLSRLKLLNSGEFQAFVQRDPARLEVIHQLNAVVHIAQPIIANLEEPGAALRVLELLSPLGTKLAKLASAANRFGAEQVAQDQSELTRLHWLSTAVLGGLIASGLILIALLLWSKRLLNRAHAELHELADDLRTKTVLLGTTFESMDQGLIMFDASGAVQTYNRRAIELLNLPHEYMESRPSFEAIHQIQLGHGIIRNETKAESSSSLTKRNAEERADVHEWQRADGTVLEIRTAYLRDGGVVCTYSDITQRRLAERAKDDFLMTISHEIRTPLTGVLGIAELLAVGESDNKQRSYVQAIRSSGQHLLAVVNDVLDFSRIQAGKLELSNVNFSVLTLIERIRSVMHLQAVERGVELQIEIASPPPPTVKGDPTRLTQVLLNLVGNGLKFTPQGYVTVSVTYHFQQNGRIKLRFDVRDTGIGIPDEKRPDLFNPFVQVDSSTKRRYGGSGLGLAISQRLVEAMGSSIQFASILGVGSHFWFEVTLDIGDEVASAEQFRFDPSGVSPRRILIAEDVELNRTLLRDVLSRFGHEVTFAVNGADAVEAVKRENFDVILMDVQMPVMDGIEATRRIRQLEEPVRNIRIVGLTANVATTERERYLASGMDDCLTKPLDFSQLFSALAGQEDHVPDRDPVDGRISPGVQPPLVSQKTIEQLGATLARDEVRILLENALSNAEHATGKLEELSGNRAELVQEAHSLKGMSGLFGLNGIRAIAGEIESAAKTGQDVEEITGRLRQTLADTRAALRRSGLCNE